MARPSATLPAGRRAAMPTREPMPQRIEPMLATLASEVPSDDAKWGYEFKWDGVRAVTFWDGRELRILSRNLLDITRRYPELHDLGRALGRSEPTILDGEIVALDPVSGRPSFARLQRRMHVDNPSAGGLPRDVPVWYILFDVLYAHGRSTLSLPYERRRELLESLTIEGPSWQITPAQHGGGATMLAAARKSGLEGVVAKRLDSVYEPGRRSPAWLKLKVVFGQEFVIGGWVPEAGQHGAARVGSLLLGYYDCRPRRAGAAAPRALRYAGGVGTGYTDATHASLVRLLEQRRAATSPFADRVPKAGAIYVRPDLVAEVEFRRWPVGGLVQQASFKGLRTDKEAKDVVKEDHSTCPS